MKDIKPSNLEQEREKFFNSNKIFINNNNTSIVSSSLGLSPFMQEILEYQEMLYTFQPYIKFWISAKHPYGFNYNEKNYINVSGAQDVNQSQDAYDNNKIIDL